MNKINTYLAQIKKYYRKYPVVVVPTIAILAFGLFTAVEYVRAGVYIHASTDYKSSTSVAALLDGVESLALTSEKEPPAIFCSLGGALVQSYEDKSASIYDGLKKTVENLPQPPTFRSFAVFLPQVSKARKDSAQTNTAHNTVKSLFNEDVRSTYCTQLATILSSIYFVEDLEKPEAVSALQVGQVEDFQVKISKAQDKLVALGFPSDFQQEHSQITELLSQYAKTLRSDDNKYISFARSMETTNKQLTALLSSIAQKAADLQERTKDLKIAAASLENER